jgi:hypothetical protein
MADRSLLFIHVSRLVGAVLLASALDPALAETAAPGEAWRTSPYHGVTNPATGQRIPCLCRFKGEDYRLGASVCMNTHVGTVIARCDLELNNTTWKPTDQPCVVSRAPDGRHDLRSIAALSGD